MINRARVLADARRQERRLAERRRYMAEQRQKRKAILDDIRSAERQGLTSRVGQLVGMLQGIHVVPKS